ncbi:uncharacterized protein LOC134195891 isoform X3 [Corticium candelabrum]|uniref:uncharacterized protein LOC134195891 isoform X3 n=1 Tax=Corticium candelabrum TaxID=121492 RepID=UPI002E253CE6|nr:uncharacterized protein LOC134195891 isoform X3 [Corticium candelabrum]
MSNRKQFESLLSQLESVYNQDVLDERRRADELESRLNRLKQDKITLKQEVHRLKSEVSKCAHSAVRATQDCRLEVKKHKDCICTLVSRVKFMEKILLSWIGKIRALGLELNFESMSTVECDLSNGFDYTKQIEQDVFRGANDLYSRDDGDGSSSSGIVTDENVVDRTRSAQLLSGTHVNAEQTEQLNGNEKMHSCRKTRVINTPAYHKPLNRSEVQDPVSCLFLDETSHHSVLPIPQSDSQLSLDITSTPQPSPEVPNRRTVKSLEGKQSLLGRSRKSSRFKYMYVGRNKIKEDRQNQTVGKEYNQLVLDDKGLFDDDNMTNGLDALEDGRPVCTVDMHAEEYSECQHGEWNLYTGLRTPRSDKTIVLFSEDRNQSTRHRTITNDDESTCWESPFEDDDNDDDCYLQEKSLALLNENLDQLRELSQGCPVLSRLYCHVASGSLDDDNATTYEDKDTAGLAERLETPNGDVDRNIKSKRLGDDLGYKYHEVVRKKDLRQQLDGHVCKCCEKFYQDQNLSPNSKHHLLKFVSRHKSLHTPPQTPPGFWSLRMPDSEECLRKGYIKDDKHTRPLKRKLKKFLPETEGEDMSKNVSDLMKKRATRLY